MSDEVQDLAKRALSRAIKGSIARAVERAERPKPPSPPVASFEEDKPKRSEDALDHRAFRRGGFSKAEKRAYAQQKFVEDLVQPPKNPPPAWLSDPSLLPKKPPTRKE